MFDQSQLQHKPFITVFTPTYNRAYSLGDVYESLCAQSMQNFEWVIVDDGSADNTTDLVQSWIDENRISIRYAKKVNGGKHTAINLGVEMAQGEWFLIFDSDDKCTPNTIERFYQLCQTLSAAELSAISTISVRSVTDSGTNVGPEYAFKQKIVSSPSEQLMLRSQAERWGINKTALMRDNLFPVFPGERFVPESLIWNRLSLHYSTLFVNEGLRIFTPREDGLTASMLKIRVNSPNGAALVYKEMLLLELGYWDRYKALINYFRFESRAKGISLSWVINPLAWLGVLLRLADSVRLKIGE
ncbi:glycosyltransferase family 2 protein [Rheinheimera sp. D18]|uniref:glycosyltransferase family A protein n=1 Tax=Rheinheimera sp. D18 TaxID=2545632 RepID=UPI0014053C73|nr:glycosyltransferase family 2 protein [Rheinheimera sp. D18]